MEKPPERTFIGIEKKIANTIWKDGWKEGHAAGIRWGKSMFSFKRYFVTLNIMVLVAFLSGTAFGVALDISTDYGWRNSISAKTPSPNR